jgi:hypothetical protein
VRPSEVLPPPEKVLRLEQVLTRQQGGPRRRTPSRASAISYEKRPTAMHDTDAPVVILKPVEAFVALMPRPT